jgi:hypothetical protein
MDRLWATDRGNETKSSLRHGIQPTGQATAIGDQVAARHLLAVNNGSIGGYDEESERLGDNPEFSSFQATSWPIWAITAA